MEALFGRAEFSRNRAKGRLRNSESRIPESRDEKHRPPTDNPEAFPPSPKEMPTMAFAEKQAALAERLTRLRLVPVLVLENVDTGLRLCELLVENGLPAAEITFRTPAAADVLRAARARFPEMLLGAGTVLSPDDLRRAFDHGAEFAVAPGFNPAVVEAARKDDLPFAPGVCTPSEIEQALAMGLRLLKFFPAEAAGGVAMLKAMSAPYRHLGPRFMPTGGITGANAPAYWAMPEVAAVGGTWLGRAQDLEAGRWDAVAQTIADAVALLRTSVGVRTK